MALTPPNNNFGEYNTSPTGPVTWDEVQNTNHQTIDRNDMPFASTVEYKGYYKAEATGDHTFTLSGSSSVTGYSWLSSAPRGSDHIKLGSNQKVSVTFNKSYGIIIPNKRSSGYWVFEDTNVLGTSFQGYGYWPKSGYGRKGNTSTGWKSLYTGQDAPSNACSFTQVDHETMLPGDIRTYENAPVTQFGGRQAGPGWQGPEDPNFSSPCYLDGTQNLPLKRVCRSTDPRPCDSDANPTTAGKTSQVFLDTSFKAEGVSDDAWAIYEIVEDNRDSEGDGNPVYIWPKTVNVFKDKTTSKAAPERVNIRFGLRFTTGSTQNYTFEWKSRDGLKMWYRIGGGDSREFIKFPDGDDDTFGTGNNPCNLTAPQNGNGNIWQPGGGEDGFTGQLTLANNAFIQFIGHAVGVPGTNGHGWSLIIKDENGDVVWETDELLTADGDGLIGIDECGFNALLGTSDRISANKSTELFKEDGWKGYTNGDVFVADTLAGDNTARDYSTTRQYLWSNALTKTRGGQNIPGTVYLRQGDYYFIRTIVSNDKNQSANFQFKVAGPTGGISQSVKFSGNGDPSSDTSVGGTALGNGTPINKDVLCSSVLAPNGQSINNSDVNFALVNRLGLVLNLTDEPTPGVSDGEIGQEGQGEVITIPGGSTSTGPDSKLITFNEGGFNEQITLTQLVRAGTGDIPDFTENQIGAIFATYQRQINQEKTLDINTFRSAITSRAVIQWGLGGNYPFIYHAVSDVINAICSGTDIDVPVRPTQNNLSAADGRGLNVSQTDGTCIDVDFAKLSGGAAQITSECLNSCKTPDTFTRPESQYKKTDSDFAGMDSRYANKVKVQNNYGVVAPSTWSAPTPSSYGDYDVSYLSANYDSAKFNPGEVTAIPLFVPDVFVPDEFDIEANDQGNWDCSYKFELSSNTFFYNPDNSSGEIGVARPYLVWWVSATPGGPKIGDYKITRPSYSSTPKFYATMSYDQFALDQSKDSSQRRFDGYLGNTYGARWWNLAPLIYQDVQDLGFEIPEAGTTEFVDLLSTKGYTTNQIRIRGTVTSPDCTALAASRSSNRSGVDSSFRSAPDMIPFI